VVRSVARSIGGRLEAGRQGFTGVLCCSTAGVDRLRVFEATAGGWRRCVVIQTEGT
jgi:hypothetical protein